MNSVFLSDEIGPWPGLCVPSGVSPRLPRSILPFMHCKLGSSVASVKRDRMINKGGLYRDPLFKDQHLAAGQDLHVPLPPMHLGLRGRDADGTDARKPGARLGRSPPR